MPWTILLAYAYGILTMGLGIFAFLHKGSVPSLIAGGILGILAIAGAYLAKGAHPRIAFGLVALSAIASLGKSVPALVNGKPFYPDGVIAVLGVLGLVAGVAGFLGAGK